MVSKFETRFAPSNIPLPKSPTSDSVHEPPIRPPRYRSGLSPSAPLSYWAGAEGDSPLRYLGGLIGGSWTLSLVGDLGNGIFDGANLVSNFETMNPSNSLWGKNYSLF